jgi:hypothetical protein
VRPKEKLFLTVNPQKNSIFLSFYFCVLFSNGTPSEKYFSVGIQIFPWVFAHIEIFEFPVVNGHRARHAVLCHSAVVSPYAVSAR